MGWGRYFFLGDYGQQIDIEEQRNALHRVKVDQKFIDRTQDERIAALNQEVLDLKLYIGGLCQLMIGKGVVTEKEIDQLAFSAYGPRPDDTNAKSGQGDTGT